MYANLVTTESIIFVVIKQSHSYIFSYTLATQYTTATVGYSYVNQIGYFCSKTNTYIRTTMQLIRLQLMHF